MNCAVRRSLIPLSDAVAVSALLFIVGLACGVAVACWALMPIAGGA